MRTIYQGWKDIIFDPVIRGELPKSKEKEWKRLFMMFVKIKMVIYFRGKLQSD